MRHIKDDFFGDEKIFLNVIGNCSLMLLTKCHPYALEIESLNLFIIILKD